MTTRALYLHGGTIIETSEILGVVPARLRYVDIAGVTREVKVDDIRQIDPALTEPPTELAP